MTPLSGPRETANLPGQSTSNPNFLVDGITRVFHLATEAITRLYEVRHFASRTL
jgi:hypothetical protein